MFTPPHIKQPECRDESVQIRKNLYLSVGKRAFLMITFQECRQDDGFGSFRDFFRINHESCLKDSLHNSVVVQDVVAAAIEVKNTDCAISVPIKIAITDISLNRVLRLVFKESYFFKEMRISENDLMV